MEDGKIWTKKATVLEEANPRSYLVSLSLLSTPNTIGGQEGKCDDKNKTPGPTTPVRQCETKTPVTYAKKISHLIDSTFNMFPIVHIETIM